MRTLTALLMILLVSTVNAKQWYQGENWLQKLSLQEQQKMMGAQLPDETAFSLSNHNEDLSDLPQFHDWRNYNGSNYMTPVRNQGRCGSCVVFASIGALEAQFNIANNWPDLDMDFSEQHALACSAGTCGGWVVGAASTYLQLSGVITESYFPYISGSIGEDLICKTFSDANHFKTRGSQYVGLLTNMDYTHGIFEVIPVTKRKVIQALLKGPMATSMRVFEDFIGYSNGIYSHSTGKLLGGHAVVIVGYSIPENYWIVKNSWGPDWGEAGYFRVSMDDDLSEIGKYNYLHHVDPFEGGNISIVGLKERSTLRNSDTIEIVSSYKSTWYTRVLLSKNGKKIATIPAIIKDGLSGLFHKKERMIFNAKARWNRFEDGLYTIQAVSTIYDKGFKKKYSEPKEIIIVSENPKTQIAITDIIQNDESLNTTMPIQNKVYLKLALNYNQIPPQRVEVVITHPSGEITIIQNEKPAETIYISWKTQLLNNGEYQIFARAITGDFVNKSNSLQVIVNNEINK